MNRIKISVDFTSTPGPRSSDEGEFSGEEFLEKILDPKFVATVQEGGVLIVDFDGAEGYATSFLEASFGGLARKHGADEVLKILELKSSEDPYLIEEVVEYINDTRQSK